MVYENSKLLIFFSENSKIVNKKNEQDSESKKITQKRPPKITAHQKIPDNKQQITEKSENFESIVKPKTGI